MAHWLRPIFATPSYEEAFMAVRFEAERLSTMSRKSAAQSPGLSWISLKKEWQAWYGDHGPALHFCLKFGGLMAVFYGLGYATFWGLIYPSYLHGNAWLSGHILNLFGQGTAVAGVTIRSSRYAIDIKPGCDALEPLGMLISALWAHPASARQRTLGIGLGALVILPLNLVRIVTLFLAGSYFPSFFSTLHLEIWPVAFIVATLLLFVKWVQWTKAENAKS